MEKICEIIWLAVVSLVLVCWVFSPVGINPNTATRQNEATPNAKVTSMREKAAVLGRHRRRAVKGGNIKGIIVDRSSGRVEDFSSSPEMERRSSQKSAQPVIGGYPSTARRSLPAWRSFTLTNYCTG
jgi:hypothetical protein